MRDKRLQQLEADNYQEEQAAEDEAYSESDVRSTTVSSIDLSSIKPQLYLMYPTKEFPLVPLSNCAYDLIISAMMMKWL